MSQLSRTLALAATSLLLAAQVQAAPSQAAESFQLELPLRAAAAQPAPTKTTASSSIVAAPVASAARSQPRSRADVIAELRAARAQGELNFAEAEIGWPVHARVAR